MISQQLEERSQPLEARVAALETELTQLKQVLAALLPKPTPWWLKIAGSFEDDPTFDTAMNFGQDWRKTAD